MMVVIAVFNHTLFQRAQSVSPVCYVHCMLGTSAKIRARRVCMLHEVTEVGGDKHNQTCKCMLER